MKNLGTYAVVCCLFSLIAISSCGPVKQAVQTTQIPPLPDQAQADSLMLAFTGQGKSLNIPFQYDERPKVYGFLPDSSNLTIYTLCPENGEWKKENETNWSCFDGDGLNFKSFMDLSVGANSDGKKAISFKTIHENGSDASKTYLFYDPYAEYLASIFLTGKILSDGRIEGSSNKNLIDGLDRVEVQGLISSMESDSTVIELSESELKTIQALEWWESKNPNALKNATKLNFGQIPEDCTLVESFKAAGKEKSSKYTVAQFQVRGRNVIVAQRRSNGEYILVWVEPVKYNGRTIENFYFDNDNILSILYYQGRKSFKYRINLATMALSR